MNGRDVSARFDGWILVVSSAAGVQLSNDVVERAPLAAGGCAASRHRAARERKDVLAAVGHHSHHHRR